MQIDANINSDASEQARQRNPADNPSNSSAQSTQQNQPRMHTVVRLTDTPHWQTTSTATGRGTGSRNSKSSAFFSFAEMEAEWSTFMLLKNRRQLAAVIAPNNLRPYFSELPREIKTHIFNQLPQAAFFDPALFSLARTGKSWSAEVKEYLAPEHVFIGFGGKLLRAEVVASWQSRSRNLLIQTPVLRANFKLSKALIQQSIADHASAETIAHAVSHLAGVKLNLQSINNAALLFELLGKLHKQPIKLDAKTIGRERFLQLVLPALSHINPDCPVVLDASDNALQPNDLQLLVLQIKKNPCIMHLNLSGNLFCTDREICQPFVALFHTPSPLSHIYLRSTGLNNRTACQISKSLTNNPCLRHLDLQLNSLTQRGALALINALAFTNEAGVKQVNSAICALRLQSNNYGNANLKIFSAIDTVHILLAKARNAQRDRLTSELPCIVQVDGISHAFSQFNTMQKIKLRRFDQEAKAEKL